jgi:hypothetical protein
MMARQKHSFIPHHFRDSRGFVFHQLQVHDTLQGREFRLSMIVLNKTPPFCNGRGEFHLAENEALIPLVDAFGVQPGPVRLLIF